MKLSQKWLESYFAYTPNWDEILYSLTMAGIEIENITPVVPEFSGIVVAKVVACDKHPDADKLTICKVDAGTGELLQIVCGASNVTAGIKVPCAKVDARLPDGLVIDKRKMRGIDSFGMLCSGNEIGCPDGVDGLLILAADAPIGVDVRSYLDLDDKIIELKITPNRGDCLSVLGILREIQVLTKSKLQLPPVKNDVLQQEADQAKIIVNLEAKNVCPNYFALVINGVDNQAKLPLEIIRRIERSSIKSISPIVDITNYVMLELGQPLHAFDLAKIGNKIQIRMARNGEQVKLLNDKEVTLTADTLVIGNENNQVAAIAGVMGGADSGVSGTTQDLVLESAFFIPEVIAGKAKYYNVASDAAYRYERGVDPQLQQTAINLAANLIIKYCGGKIGGLNANNSSYIPPIISLKYNEIIHLIGVPIAKSDIDNILLNLGFKFTLQDADGFTIEVPSFRFDIKVKEDIVEEIVRVYGYDKIEPIMPITGYSIVKPDALHSYQYNLKSKLVNSGYSEIISYAFLEEKLEKLFGLPNIKPIKLQNPIAGLTTMRTSLVADLVKALTANLNRGHKWIRLFELARVFYDEVEDQQPLKLSGLAYGNALIPGWANGARVLDFYDLKRDVELLLDGIGLVSFVACSDYLTLHSGRCAKIYANQQEIGIIGQLHPKYFAELGLTDLPYVFELDVMSMFNFYSNSKIKVKEISKFQKVERDLAFVLANKVNVGLITDAIMQSNIPYLVTLNVFDVYQGSNLEPDSKSVAINFLFQADKTLTEEEISYSLDKIINIVTEKFFARLRR